MTVANKSIERSPRRALCVGINAYGDSSLTGAVADALSWRNALAANGFDVSVLVDQQATKRAILDGLRALTESGAPGDVLVFSFSGLGANAPDAEGDAQTSYDQVLVPVDFLAGEVIWNDELADSIRLPSDVSLTTFLDCCFSGVVSRYPNANQPVSTGRDQRPRFLKATKEWLASVKPRPNAMRPASSLGKVMAYRIANFMACEEVGVAWERDGGGEFSRRAALLLAGGIPHLTNRQVNQRLGEAFGPTSAQRPAFSGSATMTDALFLCGATGQ